MQMTKFLPVLILLLFAGQVFPWAGGGGLTVSDSAKLDKLVVRGANIGPVDGVGIEFANGGKMNGNSGDDTWITNGSGRATYLVDDVSGARYIGINNSGVGTFNQPSISMAVNGNITLAPSASATGKITLPNGTTISGDSGSAAKIIPGSGQPLELYEDGGVLYWSVDTSGHLVAAGTSQQLRADAFTGNLGTDSPDLPNGYSVGSMLVTTAGGTRMAAGWRMMYGPNDGTADGYEVAAVYGSAYGWKSVPNGGTVVGSAEMNFSGTGFEVVDLYAARRLGARDDENPFVLRFGSKTTYTLSTGDAAMSGYATRVVIAAQSGTADDWDSASNAALTITDGGFYYIQADAGDTITIRDASAGGTGGNIETTTGANIVLTGEALALAFWDETGSVLIVAPLF